MSFLKAFLNSKKYLCKTNRFTSLFAIPIKKSLVLFSIFCLFASQTLTVSAEPTAEEIAAANAALPVQSNEIKNWPQGPAVSAEAAILMEAETGMILYAKNIHEKEYPASTTKILTTLIAAEQCDMDEMVTFSHEAVFDTPRDSNHIAIDEGEALTMEQCINAILIRSANEVSFAVAEHISGTTWQDFAEIMNQRAAELGCINSNFVNPNGLPDENHYTTAYDLAMIGKAFFANEMLCKITLSPTLNIPASDTQPQNIIEHNAMAIIPGKQYAYEYLIGCKTGYTNAARSCLVSCAEKDGMKLICVVLRDEAPLQYEDTISLFEYGFNNFYRANVSQTDNKYNMEDTDFFYSETDVFGNSTPILSLDKEDYIILPKTITFEDTKSIVSYDTQEKNQAALIQYIYEGVPLGTASVNFAAQKETTSGFDTLPTASDSEKETSQTDAPTFIFINIVQIFLWVLGIGFLIFLIFAIRFFVKNYHFPQKRNSRSEWKKNRKKRFIPYENVNESLKNKRKLQMQQAKRQRKQAKQIQIRRKKQRKN